QAFSAAEAECRSSGHRMRLRVIAEDERLACLPFEFIGHPSTGDPLLLDPFYSLVRSVNKPLVSLEPVEDRPLRVLLVGASPRAENLPWIDTEAETVLIRGALRPLIQQGRVTMQVLLQATPEQLRRALLESKEPFDLVHLISHTTTEFGKEVFFALEGEGGLSDPVPVQVVGKWLLAAGVRVVVIDGCNAAMLGWWLANAGMPAAIVMQGAVSDALTTEFTHNLYAFLAESLPLDAAVSLARRLQFEHMQFRPDWGAASLYLQSAASFLFTPLKKLFPGPPEKPPEKSEARPDWLDIVALAESGDAADRVRACRELAAFYDHEVATRPELSQLLSGRAEEAIERLLQLAQSDPFEEVLRDAQSSLSILRPPHFDQLFDRFMAQLTSDDATARRSAEEILKLHGQFDRALLATIQSRIHQGNLCFAGRANRIEVRLETGYPGEVRLQCEFGPRFDDARDTAAMDRQEVVLIGPRRQAGSLLSEVIPPEPGDFDFWVTLHLNGYSAPPAIHRIRCQPLNPYEFGTGLNDPGMFYGREKELRELVQGARRQNRLIIGERRIGKTSLLEAVERQLGAPLIPVMLDLPPEEELFYAIVQRAYTVARLRAPELPSLPELSVPARATFSLYQAEATMETIIEHLKRGYASDAKFVLLIDEGDELFSDFDASTRIAMRQFIHDLHLSVMVACVRAPRRIERRSSLLNIFLSLRLRPLTAEQTCRLIREPVAGVLTFDDRAVGFIVEKTQGRPAFIQNICYYAVERAHEHSQPQIALSDVQAVYQEYLLALDFPPLKDVWDQLSSEAQEELLASVDKKPLPDQSLEELRKLSMIENTDTTPRLPVVFADWIREGRKGSWLTPTTL
ncbi:MAG: CHAT domain-containing protein, partial [Acidobacteria bacterium]|nr:CHAT domain-containing protein [Acidobacteriota bacterium]